MSLRKIASIEIAVDGHGNIVVYPHYESDIALPHDMYGLLDRIVLVLRTSVCTKLNSQYMRDSIATTEFDRKSKILKKRIEAGRSERK